MLRGACAGADAGVEAENPGELNACTAITHYTTSDGNSSHSRAKAKAEPAAPESIVATQAESPTSFSRTCSQ